MREHTNESESESERESESESEIESSEGESESESERMLGKIFQGGEMSERRPGSESEQGKETTTLATHHPCAGGGFRGAVAHTMHQQQHAMNEDY